VCVELAEELKVGLNQNKIYAAAVDDDGEWQLIMTGICNFNLFWI
jgi:hypothetical protein